MHWVLAAVVNALPARKCTSPSSDEDFGKVRQTGGLTRQQRPPDDLPFHTLLDFERAGQLLTVVGPAGDAVVVGADGLGVKWPRPVVSGGAVVVGVPGLSAR